MKKINIFCAKDQEITEHEASIDQNGEFLFECLTKDCGRFLKLPLDFPSESLEEYLANHHDVNLGQVSLEEQEKKLDEMLSNLE